jgi:hypothetical protein
MIGRETLVRRHGYNATFQRHAGSESEAGCEETTKGDVA